MGLSGVFGTARRYAGSHGRWGLARHGGYGRLSVPNGLSGLGRHGALTVPKGLSLLDGHLPGNGLATHGLRRNGLIPREWRLASGYGLLVTSGSGLVPYGVGCRLGRHLTGHRGRSDGLRLTHGLLYGGLSLYLDRLGTGHSRGGRSSLRLCGSGKSGRSLLYLLGYGLRFGLKRRLGNGLGLNGNRFCDGGFGSLDLFERDGSVGIGGEGPHAIDLVLSGGGEGLAEIDDELGDHGLRVFGFDSVFTDDGVGDHSVVFAQERTEYQLFTFGCLLFEECAEVGDDDPAVLRYELFQ